METETEVDDAEPKIALVTGASRGIGQAIALALAQAGLVVVGTATTESGAAAITERLERIGHRGGGQVMQLADAHSVEESYKAIQDRFGSPQVLINNAGITHDNLFPRMKSSQWEEVIEINLISVLRLTKLALRPMLKARWGRIINMSSVVASSGNPGQVNYCAAKAGLEGMTRSLAREVASRAITVNAVAPGYVETDMTAQLSDEQHQAAISSVPLGRMGHVEEVAHVVGFLASAEASYITGATIPVNGGLYM